MRSNSNEQEHLQNNEPEDIHEAKVKRVDMLPLRKKVNGVRRIKIGGIFLRKSALKKMSGGEKLTFEEMKLIYGENSSVD